MPLKLNLGCGHHKLPGYLNVDSQAQCSPDQVVDLEQFPWPWPDQSVEEIRLSHVLEHLGATTEKYFGVMRELYRVCAPNALIHIAVPHPRSDSYIADPTHVRPITTVGLSMFDQELNRQWIAEDSSTTPLGIYLGINFKIDNTEVDILEPWYSKFINNQINEDELRTAIQSYWNVIGETRIVLRAVK